MDPHENSECEARELRWGPIVQKRAIGDSVRSSVTFRDPENAIARAKHNGSGEP